ncbi:hypothetical protein CTAM01_00987 [Colletotrichum tamarilloi]|uniref:Uncharacterized protein n=1 Tax=Colletotrichum tamarilloi TaxID=1209934 RepID=A0ABQ9RU09_9PEZI|nr:uncharacterized protein CTAM01_00987 [Colletotrichum tamarilloi]KAK1512057.1 hypothetical protein CTAM01_00987 [Colletotrichum tamarilloi]
MATNHTMSMGWSYSDSGTGYYHSVVGYSNSGTSSRGYYSDGPDWAGYVSSIYRAAKNPEYPIITVNLPGRWNHSSDNFDAQKDCYDTKVLFDYSSTGRRPSTANLYGCAAIATSAFLVQSEKIDTDYSVNETISKINLDSLMAFNATKVFEQILGCIEISCAGGNPLGECDPGVAKLTRGQVRAGEMDEVLNSLQDLCSVFSNGPQADIAGPGIAVSYYIQVALSIWFFIFCGLLPHQPDSSTFFGMLLAFRWCLRLFRKRSETEMDRLRSTFAHLRSTRFCVALRSTMVEFQETQAFFVMAIEAATLTMVIMNKQSLAIRVDVGAAKVFASANTLLVLVTQAIMQRRGMYWWYTFVLTVIVYVLCSIIQMLNLPTPKLVSDPSPEYEACGGRHSILQTCTQAEYGNNVYSSYVYGVSPVIPIVQFSIYTSVMLFLTMDHLSHDPRLSKMIASTYHARRGREIRIPAWVIKTFSFLGKILWFILVTVIAYTVLLNIVQVNRFAGDAVGSKEQWTFGQVVAVLVWAPVLSKYIYYNIFGIELGVGKRIDDQYKVVLNKEKPPSTLSGAQGQSDSSRNLVNQSNYIRLSSIGDGNEDRRPAGAETRSFSGGVKRKPLPPRTNTELPR